MEERAPNTTDWPSGFIQRLKEQFGETAPSIVASLTGIRRTVFRFNRLRADTESTACALASAGIGWTAIEGVDDAGVLDDEDDRRVLTEMDAFANGEVVIQGLSSQIAALAVEARPGEHVLDLTAAPGGKTLVVAQSMAGRGRLVAVDRVKDRFHRMRAHIARTVEPTGDEFQLVTRCADGCLVGRREPSHYNRVLLDAPCSGESRFTPRDPKSFAYWSERKIRECARRQQALLASALLAVHEGGRVLYATCTFAPEENEAVLHRALTRWGACLEVETLNVPSTIAPLKTWRGRNYDDRVQGARRIMPDDLRDGFFIARLRRVGTPAFAEH